MQEEGEEEERGRGVKRYGRKETELEEDRQREGEGD